MRGEGTGLSEKELSSAALELMLGQGLVGFIWLDAALNTLAARGLIPEAVRVGEPLSKSLPALVGLEGEIVALQRQPKGRSVTVPNVGVREREGEASKLDLQVAWLAEPQLYLVVAMREPGQTGLELELRREMRARRLAESLLVEKSREIEVANKELARANRDLEEFAYVIAHDLKAPLRAMRVTAERLEHELGQQAAEGMRASLSLIRLQSRRMGQMLSGLLEYSRVGRKKEAESEVDVRALAEEIASTAKAAGGIRIEIAAGAWPRLVTLRAPLDVVLRNLVENAVKHHDRDNGVVRLACEDGGSHWIFTVEDDGPGIARDYHAAVFEPFRRVDDDGTAEGSGIGLALVQKTLELAGGSIELLSDPSARRGSVFRVSWPKVIPA